MAAELVTRYLDLLKNSLLNVLYIENEVKISYLISCLAKQTPPDYKILVDPQLETELMAAVSEAKLEGGVLTLTLPDKNGQLQPAHHLRNFIESPHTMIGEKRMDNIAYCVREILSNDIPGDLIETGVWRGGATVFMRGLLQAYEDTTRNVWVADSFEGVPAPSIEQDHGVNLSKDTFPVLAVNLEQVKSLFKRYDLLDDRVKFLQGWFKDTLHTADIKSLSLLRLDGDLYESTMDALQALYPKLSPGGFIIIDDYHALEVCKAAVHDYRDQHQIDDDMIDIDSMSVYWRKS